MQWGFYWGFWGIMTSFWFVFDSSLCFVQIHLTESKDKGVQFLTLPYEGSQKGFYYIAFWTFGIKEKKFINKAVEYSNQFQISFIDYPTVILLETQIL